MKKMFLFVLIIKIKKYFFCSVISVFLIYNKIGSGIPIDIIFFGSTNLVDITAFLI